jgi:hypothetical protein
MRGVVVVALFAACGRLGFDPAAEEGTVKSDGAPVVDSAFDAAIGSGSYTVSETTAPYAMPADAQPIPGFSSAADEDNFELALPFPFVFYGVTYSTAFANVNGFVTFGPPPAAADSFPNDCPFDATAPDAMIAVFWDDLLAKDSVATAAMSTATIGTAPDRAFVIEWHDLDAFFRAGTGNNNFSQGIKVTQQVVLHESGAIDLHYGPRTPPTQDRDCGLQRHEGCSATVGLEASGGQLSTLVQCGTETGPIAPFSPLVEGRLIRFVPN